MTYDEGLAQRLRALLVEQAGIEEKKMFGGVAYMLNGNLACGVIRDELIVRVGLGKYDEALSRDHVRPFDFTGRTMKGWIMVSPEGCESDEDLEDLVQQGLDFAASLSPK